MDKTRIFISKANVIHNNKYDYSLVIYKRSDEKVDIICPEHGKFKQSPSCHIVKKQGCPKCAGVKKKNTFDFISECKKNFDQYDYSIVDYKNNKTKVKIICPEHGIFETRPDNFIHYKIGCPKCANNVLYTKDDFIMKSNFIHKNKYDYSSVVYKTAHDKIDIICPIHGTFRQKPYSHYNIGTGCPKCVRQSVYETDFFISQSIIVHKNKYDYSLVGEIKTNNSKVKIICPIHGIFEQKVCSHINGCGCYRCKESSGETQITNILEKNGIKFEKQKKFNDCKYKNLLPFDFYLPDYSICIEYDGIHHTKPMENWGGKKEFEKQKIKDQIKNVFCENIGIRLIRIKYNENIKEKLSEELKF